MEIKTRLQLLEEMGYADKGTKNNHDDKWVSVETLIWWLERMENLGHDEGVIKALKDRLQRDNNDETNNG